MVFSAKNDNFPKGRNRLLKQVDGSNNQVMHVQPKDATNNTVFDIGGRAEVFQLWQIMYLNYWLDY